MHMQERDRREGRGKIMILILTCGQSATIFARPVRTAQRSTTRVGSRGRIARPGVPLRAPAIMTLLHQAPTKVTKEHTDNALHVFPLRALRVPGGEAGVQSTHVLCIVSGFCRRCASVGVYIVDGARRRDARLLIGRSTRWCTIIVRVDRRAADVGFDRLSQRQPHHVLDRTKRPNAYATVMTPTAQPTSVAPRP